MSNELIVRRPLGEVFRRPIVMIMANRLAPGDIIHDCDNRELRGLVVALREARWGNEDIIWVETSEDVATRRIDKQSTLRVTRGWEEPARRAI